MRTRLLVLLFALALCGCNTESPQPQETPTVPPPPEETSPPALASLSLIDSIYAPFFDLPPSYTRSAYADLDGDGEEEKVVLQGMVGEENGEPMWDDGQPWRVYVEEPDGTRTMVFLKWVQLGYADAMLTDAKPNPTLLIEIRSHNGLTLYEVRYDGPQQEQAQELVNSAFHPRSDFEGSPHFSKHFFR